MLIPLFVMLDSHLSAPSSLEEQSSIEKEEEYFYCRLCGELITSSRNIIEVEGKSLHIFTNPAGYVFQIRCFSTGQGIRPVGKPTDFFSWFSGTIWNYALCRSCETHIGWHFFTEGGGSSFYGLIADKLTNRAP